MPGLYQVKEGDQAGDLVLAPYLLCLGTWGDGDRIFADLLVKIKSKVPTSDLRRIKGIQCRVEVKEQTRKSDD